MTIENYPHKKEKNPRKKVSKMFGMTLQERKNELKKKKAQLLKKKQRLSLKSSRLKIGNK